MAQDSSSDKTEEATPKKLRDARKKGQVPNSKDVPSALIMLIASIYFWVLGDWLLEKLAEIFIIIPQLQVLSFKEALSASMKIVLDVGVMTIVLPIVGLAALTGILGNIIQFGIVFSVDPVIPRMSKISPGEGFQRIFSAKQFVNTFFSLIKTLLIAIALFIVVRMGLTELLHELKQCDVLCQELVVSDLLSTLMMIILPIILTLAILDFMFQKAQFDKDQRMTKEEIKREMKDMYGDPHVKGARHGLRRELTEQDIHSRIKTARLIVVDIGVAVALYYERGTTPLPVIVAIGKAAMARKMVEIAQVENVAIVSDARLVADMLKEGKLDQYIPTITIDRVAQAMRKTNKR